MLIASKIKNITTTYVIKECVVKGRVKPFPVIHENENEEKRYLVAILFDKTSAIHLIAFGRDCDIFFKQLQTDYVVSIGNVSVEKIDKSCPSRFTNHEYRLRLKSTSIITRINDAETNDDFPIHQFVSGHEIKNLKDKTFIDVRGICIKYDVNTHYYEKMMMKVDDVKIYIRLNDSNKEIYKEGSTLCIYNAKISSYLFKCKHLLADIKLNSFIICEHELQLPMNSNSDQPIKMGNDLQLMSIIAEGSVIEKVSQDTHEEIFTLDFNSVSDKKFVGDLMNILESLKNDATSSDQDKLKRHILEFTQSEKIKICHSDVSKNPVDNIYYAAPGICQSKNVEGILFF